MCQICNLVLRYRSNKPLSFNTSNLTTTILPTAISNPKQIRDRGNSAKKEKFLGYFSL